MLPRIGAAAWRAMRAAWADPGTRKVLRLMVPALLGVSVAQISLLINTQIASHLAPGSVTWITYADRLMEFPTAMLGVALGVVLMPQLAAARGQRRTMRYSAMLDWGLRLVVLLAVPCAVGAAGVRQAAGGGAVPLRRLHRRWTSQRTAAALMGYGVGPARHRGHQGAGARLLRRQDMRTPMRIAACVLVLTQVLNIFLVPSAAACGADAVDRHRRAGQCVVAAGRAWCGAAATGPRRAGACI